MLDPVYRWRKEVAAIVRSDEFRQLQADKTRIGADPRDSDLARRLTRERLSNQSIYACARTWDVRAVQPMRPDLLELAIQICLVGQEQQAPPAGIGRAIRQRGAVSDAT